MSSRGFYPDWYEKLPPAGSYRSILKWGAPEVFKHPNRQLYELMKDRLALSDDDFQRKTELGEQPVAFDLPGKLSAEILSALQGIVGPDNVLTDDYQRLRYNYGKTMLDLIRLRKMQVENLPDAVICPRSVQDVRAIVELCQREQIAIVPFGGGTSVTRGTECFSETSKGGICLLMSRHMNRIVELNTVNQTVTVQAGMLGPDLERELNEAPERFGAPHGYTCGHFPQSFEFSTVGGWVVARGAGQNSTYYGKIESLVVSQQYVTPAGEIVTQEYPAHAMGPDIDQLMIGSEGAFGILVTATLKVFRHLPNSRRRFSFIFKDWDNAVAATREIMQSEFGVPSVLRLSDPEETDVGLKLYGVDRLLSRVLQLGGFRPGKRCLMLGTADGHGDYTSAVARNVRKIARQHGALYTSGFVTKAWEHGRFRDPYLREDLHDYGVIIDTLECSVPWDRLHRVWRGVRAYCHSRPHTVCMCHMSHVYPQGANLYFIFIAKLPELEDYLPYQAGMLDAIHKHGAALTHHHGVGKMMAPWFEAAIGTNQLAVLRALKRHFDPTGIMNPGGTLALDLPDEQRRIVP